MARALRPPDPYRTLGIAPGADLAQVKAAHRRLAKRFHPDGSTGDEGRFLAVQEAYQLLSDPVRRREWDHRHAPGPVRARASQSAPARSEPAAPPRASDQAGRRRGTPRAARPDRPPGQRTRTWSAAHVPWWGDFRSGASPAADAPASAADGPDVAGPSQAVDPDVPTDPSVMDFDVFARSSGAAWSAAARQHFRRGTSDLPSRGVWRYRGTQVVTGAEARKVAAEEDDERKRRG